MCVRRLDAAGIEDSLFAVVGGCLLTVGLTHDTALDAYCLSSR